MNEEEKILEETESPFENDGKSIWANFLASLFMLGTFEKGEDQNGGQQSDL